MSNEEITINELKVKLEDLKATVKHLEGMVAYYKEENEDYKSDRSNFLKQIAIFKNRLEKIRDVSIGVGV